MEGWEGGAGREEVEAREGCEGGFGIGEDSASGEGGAGREDGGK